MIFKVGFTGTSKGMTISQELGVREKLKSLKEEHLDCVMELHHGLCIGADEQAAHIAKSLGYRIVAHPGFNPKNPTSTLFRSEFNENDEVRPEKPFAARDRNIVDETDRMVAAPLTREEQIRSGTWTTVRYAAKKNKPCDKVFPDEQMDQTLGKNFRRLQ